MFTDLNLLPYDYTNTEELFGFKTFGLEIGSDLENQFLATIQKKTNNVVEKSPIHPNKTSNQDTKRSFSAASGPKTVSYSPKKIKRALPSPETSTDSEESYESSLEIKTNKIKPLPASLKDPIPLKKFKTSPNSTALPVVNKKNEIATSPKPLRRQFRMKTVYPARTLPLPPDKITKILQRCHEIININYSQKKLTRLHNVDVKFYPAKKLETFIKSLKPKKGALVLDWLEFMRPNTSAYVINIINSYYKTTRSNNHSKFKYRFMQIFKATECNSNYIISIKNLITDVKKIYKNQDKSSSIEESSKSIENPSTDVENDSEPIDDQSNDLEYSIENTEHETPDIENDAELEDNQYAVRILPLSDNQKKSLLSQSNKIIEKYYFHKQILKISKQKGIHRFSVKEIAKFLKSLNDDQSALILDWLKFMGPYGTSTVIKMINYLYDTVYVKNTLTNLDTILDRFCTVTNPNKQYFKDIMSYFTRMRQ